MKLNFVINGKKATVAAKESDALKDVIKKALEKVKVKETKKIKGGTVGKFKGPVAFGRYLNVKSRISELPLVDNSTITIEKRESA